MNRIIFNSNYKYNSQYNTDKINELVDLIMEEDVNPQTLDFLFRSNSRTHSETYHEVLDLPGNFEEVKDTMVFVIGGTAKQLDYFETVTKGGIVKRDACVNAEQQKGKLKPSKVVDIFEYCLYSGFQENRLCYPVVVTDYDYGKEFEDYEVEGRSFRIYFRIYNREKIEKILNTLKSKDYNKYELTDSDYVQFLFCLIFANGEFAKEVIEEVVYQFATMEKIKFNHQMGLFLALKMIIKFRFGDDLKRKRELLVMIVKSVHGSKYEELEGYESEQVSLEDIKSEYAAYKAETGEAMAEMGKAISDMSKALSEMRDTISEMAESISKKDNWIKKAKKALEENHIII